MDVVFGSCVPGLYNYFSEQERSKYNSNSHYFYFVKKIQ